MSCPSFCWRRKSNLDLGPGRIKLDTEAAHVLGMQLLCEQTPSLGISQKPHPNINNCAHDLLNLHNRPYIPGFWMMVIEFKKEVPECSQCSCLGTVA